MSVKQTTTKKSAVKYAWDEDFEVYYEEFQVGDLVAFNDKHANGNMKFGVVTESIAESKPSVFTSGVHWKSQTLKIRSIENKPRLYSRSRDIMLSKESDVNKQTLDTGYTSAEIRAINGPITTMWTLFAASNRLCDKKIFKVSDDLIKHIKSESVRLANAYAVVSMYESELTFSSK
jgi:hypothetical protein